MSHRPASVMRLSNHYCGMRPAPHPRRLHQLGEAGAPEHKITMRFPRRRRWLLASLCWLAAGLAGPETFSAVDPPANAQIHINAAELPGADARFGVMTHFAQGWNPDW